MHTSNHKTHLALLLTLFLGACSQVYYNFWEALGKEKRDLLVTKINDTKQNQKEIQEEFHDALDRIRKEYKYDETGLSKAYDGLSRDYDRSRAQSTELKGRILKVKEVASDLFKEWDKETKEFTNPDFRKESQAKLQASRQKFAILMSSMDKVEKNFDKVLVKMRDHVLYLKHNLNAKVLEGLKVETGAIELAIDGLIKDIDRSIQESEKFSESLK